MILKITCDICKQQYEIDCNEHGCFCTIHNYFDKGKIITKEFDELSLMFNEQNGFLECHNCGSKENFSIILVGLI